MVATPAVVSHVTAYEDYDDFHEDRERSVGVNIELT